MTTSEKPWSGVKVIGAGWGRTGTSSFKKAMEILGLGPCYHMTEVFAKGDGEFWCRYADKKPVDFDDIFKGKFQSSCDLPSCFAWKEMLAKYPDAKVVLTTRDPESWYKSLCDTIYRCQPGSPLTPFGVRIAFALGIPTKGFEYFMRKMITEDCYNNDFKKETVINHFNARNQSIIDECPTDKLLVFKATDGWEPLCKFLDVPIPDVPYPRENDTANMQKIIGFMNIAGYAALITPILVLARLYFYFKPKFGGEL